MMDNWINIIENNKIYAHICENKESETLKDHGQKTIDYFKKIKEIYGLDEVIKILCKDCLGLDEGLLKRYIEYIIQYHDIGKVNPVYQKKILQNNNLTQFIELHKISSQHSSLSFFIFLEELYKSRDDFRNKELEFITIPILSLSILNHHTDLKDLNFEEIGKEIEDKKDDFEKVYNYWNINIDRESFSYIGNVYFNKLDIIFKGKSTLNYLPEDKLTYLYLLFKLINSLLISSDFYATLEYQTGNEISFDNCIIDGTLKEKLFDNFHNTEILRDEVNFNVKINRERNNLLEEDLDSIQDINKLRNWLNVTVEKRLEEVLDKNNNKVFYLNLPTGAGKTNLSYRLALKILEKDNTIKKIFYVFPFINIVEQSYNAIEKFIPSESCIRLDSKAPIKLGISTEAENDDDLLKKIDYDLTFMNYPILFLSNVKYFDLFFRNGKVNNYGFYQLANSIVIIDEIQSYSDILWVLLAEIIFNVSKAFNIYFIIMSATLPKLDELIKKEEDVLQILDKTKIYNLLEDFETHKIFNHSSFKRITYNFKYLKNRDTTNDDKIRDILEEHFDNDYYNKVLVVVNTIKNSLFVYEKLKKIFDGKINIFLLNSTFIEFDRVKIIDTIRKWNIENKDKNKKLVLVSTQTVEAGVDLDFDLGIRCYSPLDSIVQIAGRVNREGKNDKERSILYIIYDSSWKKVYRYDYKSVVTEDYIKECFIKKEKIKELERKINESEYRTVREFYNKILNQIDKDNRNFILEGTKTKLDSIRFLQFNELNNVRIIENVQNIPVFIITQRELYENDEIDHRYIEYIRSLEKLLGINIEFNNFERVVIDSKRLWENYEKIIENRNVDERREYFSEHFKIKYLQKLMNLFTINVPIWKLNISQNELVYGYYKLDDNGLYSEKTGLNIERLGKIAEII